MNDVNSLILRVWGSDSAHMSQIRISIITRNIFFLTQLFVLEAASAMQAALLVAEGLRFCGLVHNNVLAPLAACAEEARKPLLVYCCASHSSNLKRYLNLFIFVLSCCKSFMVVTILDSN